MQTATSTIDKDLLLASSSGNHSIIPSLIARGGNVNCVDEQGQSPLHLAIKNGHLNGDKASITVKALLDNGADVNKANKNGLTPIILATKESHIDIINLLLEKKPDVNQVDNDGDTPLHIAVVMDEIDIVKALLKNNAEVNQVDNRGRIPLYKAVLVGNFNIFKVLLDEGADVSSADNYGDTPLLSAIPINCSDMIDALLKKGADVNKANKQGLTPLILATQKGLTELVRTLLEKGAEVDKADNFGRTLVYIATKNGDTELVKVLIEAKADFNQADNSGKTPLDVAIRDNQTAVIDLLLASGANYDKHLTTDNAELRAKIISIEKARAVYAGNLSIQIPEIQDAELNQERLKYLCKESGIPEHLLETSQDQPQSLEYSRIVREFQTQEREINEELNLVIGELLHTEYAKIFPAVLGFNYLQDSRFACPNENTRITIASYEAKPYLKPKNFLNEEGFDEKLFILLKNPEQAERFFSNTKDWILPKQQHDTLQRLKKEYSKQIAQFRSEQLGSEEGGNKRKSQDSDQLAQAIHRSPSPSQAPDSRRSPSPSSDPALDSRKSPSPSSDPALDSRRSPSLKRSSREI